MSVTTLLAIICLVGLLSLSAGLGVKMKDNGPFFLFYPPVFLAIFYLFFFLLPSAIVLFSPDTAVYRYSFNGYADGTWVETQAFAFCFIAVAIFVSATMMNFQEFEARARATVAALRFDQPGAMKIVYYLLFLVLPLVALYYFVNRFGGENYQDYMMNRTVERRGLGFLLMPTMWLTLLVPALFVTHAAGRARWTTLVASLGLVAVYTLAHLYLGSKSRGLIVLVYAILSWVFLKAVLRKVDLKHYVMVLGIGVALSTVGLFFGDIRESLTRGVNLEEVDSRVGWSQSFAKFNAFGGVENTAWLVENIPHNELLMGETFAAVLVGYVPRAWWENKPTGGGPALRNLIHPGSYDIVSGYQLTSYSPGIIAETFMNFGWLGLLIIAPLLGYAMALLMRWLSLVQTPLELALWVNVLWRLTYGLTGEVFGTMAGIFQMAFPVLLLHYLFRRYFRRPPAPIAVRPHAPAPVPA